MSRSPRAIRVLALLMLGFAMAPNPAATAVQLEDTGTWQVLYAVRGELLLGNVAVAVWENNVRPELFIHCKAGTPWVYVKPAIRNMLLQFDAGGTRRAQFVMKTYGFETDDQGQLIVKMEETPVPPLEALAKPEEIMAALLASEKLSLVNMRASGNRTHFEVGSLESVLRQLGDPCNALQ